MDIQPRKFNMVLPDDLTVYWYNNNPLITSFFEALSVLLPDGERFLIATLREAQTQISNGQLKQEISGFIGQEAHHSQAHRMFNSAYQRFGVDLPSMEIDFKNKVIEPLAKLTLAEKLAFGAAIEHFTAIFGEHVLRNQVALANVPDVLSAFIVWHAAEELEHKSVVFDAFQVISQADFKLRRRMFVKAMSVLVASLSKYQRLILKQSNYQPSWPVRKQAAQYFMGTQGLLSTNMSKVWDYLKADFHPSQHAHGDLLVQWTTRHPEVMAYLS